MEIFQELFLTAFLAFLFSFVVAKLVSFALGSDSGSSQPRRKSDEGIVVGERELGERLVVEGFESERRVRFVEGAVEKVKEFKDEEEFSKPVLSGAELEKEEAPVADLPEKSSEESLGVERVGVTEKEVSSIEAEHEITISDAESKEVRDDEIHVANEAEVIDEIQERDENHVRNEAEEKDEEIRSNKDENKEGESNSQNEANRDKEAGESNAKSNAKSEEIKDKEDEIVGGESNAESEVVRLGEAEVRNEKYDVQTEDIKDEEVVERDEKSNAQTEEIGDEGYDQKEALLGDDDDDDWEGIEKTELENVFAAAAKFVASEEGNEKLSSVGSDALMELYALNKVATEGPCRESQPMALMVSARAKWNAWQRLGNMSPDIAMDRYVTLLSDKVPRWKEETCVGDTEAGASGEAKPTLDPDISSCHQPESTVESQHNADQGDPTEARDLEAKDIK